MDLDFNNTDNYTHQPNKSADNHIDHQPHHLPNDNGEVPSFDPFNHEPYVHVDSFSAQTDLAQQPAVYNPPEDSAPYGSFHHAAEDLNDHTMSVEDLDMNVFDYQPSPDFAVGPFPYPNVPLSSSQHSPFENENPFDPFNHHAPEVDWAKGFDVSSESHEHEPSDVEHAAPHESSTPTTVQTSPADNSSTVDFNAMLNDLNPSASASTAPIVEGIAAPVTQPENQETEAAVLQSANGVTAPNDQSQPSLLASSASNIGNSPIGPIDPFLMSQGSQDEEMIDASEARDRVSASNRVPQGSSIPSTPPVSEDLYAPAPSPIYSNHHIYPIPTVNLADKRPRIETPFGQPPPGLEEFEKVRASASSGAPAPGVPPPGIGEDVTAPRTSLPQSSTSFNLPDPTSQLSSLYKSDFDHHAGDHLQPPPGIGPLVPPPGVEETITAQDRVPPPGLEGSAAVQNHGPPPGIAPVDTQGNYQSFPTNPAANNAPPGFPPGPVQGGPGRQEDIPWSKETQTLYDAFLTDERKYVEGQQWSSFPPNSRLFVGKCYFLNRRAIFC